MFDDSLNFLYSCILKALNPNYLIVCEIPAQLSQYYTQKIHLVTKCWHKLVASNFFLLFILIFILFGILIAKFLETYEWYLSVQYFFHFKFSNFILSSSKLIFLNLNWNFLCRFNRRINWCWLSFKGFTLLEYTWVVNFSDTLIFAIFVLSCFLFMGIFIMLKWSCIWAEIRMRN